MREWINEKTIGDNFAQFAKITQLQNYFKQIFSSILKNSMKDVLAKKVKQFLNNSETLK